MKKLLNKFKKKKKQEEIQFSNKEGYGNILYENDHTLLVHDTCRICYNKATTSTFEERLKYIASKVKIGHESILEHSNIILRLNVTNELNEDVIEFLSYTKYLNVITKHRDGRIDIIIGGSIRGLKHVIRNIHNPLNKVYEIMYELMYLLPYCYFTDMIADDIFNESAFINIDSKASGKEKEDGTTITSRQNFKTIKSTDLDVVGIDDVMKVMDSLNNIYGEEVYSFYEVMDLVTISILFKKVSRPISQQLVRHRAGITQLSQRYVDMSKGEFLSPDMFKEDIDSDKKYKINICHDEVTLNELGNLLMSVYPQLVEQGLLKEDARAYLPNNTETSLYMTFTIRNIIKFIDLREHKSAQAEIRMLATDINLIVTSILYDYIGDDLKVLILPYYKYKSIELQLIVESIDEVISEDIVNE